MRKLCCIAAALLLCAACSLPARDSRLSAAEAASRPLAFEPPAPERIELANGMVVYLLEDHELPLVQVTAFIRAGAIHEPPDRAGLAGLTGTVMRTGGTDSLAADEIDRLLENMSARMSVAVGTEQGTASLSVLREDVSRAFCLYAQMLRRPAFEKDKFEIARRTACQNLRQVPDNPQRLAFREFKTLLYAGNPRGVQPTLATLRRIGRDDLLRFHRRFFRPDRILLAVSGDFRREAMLALVRQQFDDWAAPEGSVREVARPQAPQKLRIRYLSKPVPQSTIIVGQLAPPLTSPDYFAFQVIDFIAGGGGFTSRLFAEVRTRRGLAYSVGSFYRGAPQYGVFGSYCMTKAGSTHQALELMLGILETIKRGEITEQELAGAKQALLNNFIFSFTSSSQIIMRQMQLEYDGLDPGFLSTVPDRIRGLTMADIRRAARNWLHPDGMTVLVVGDDRRFDVPPSDWQWGRAQRITTDILSRN